MARYHYDWNPCQPPLGHPPKLGARLRCQVRCYRLPLEAGIPTLSEVRSLKEDAIALFSLAAEVEHVTECLLIALAEIRAILLSNAPPCEPRDLVVPPEETDHAHAGTLITYESACRACTTVCVAHALKAYADA